MSSWTDLAKRSCEPEIMDDPALDPPRHVAALRGLERINRWSRSSGIIWSAIRGLARDAGAEGLRLLDVATGAGDVPIRLIRRARRAGVTLHVDACDASSTALLHARRRADAAGAGIRFFKLDALRDLLPTDYDVLTTSLFLHHLSNDEAVSLLAAMAKAGRRLLLVNDLLRCPSGVALAYLGSRLLTASRVVHVDAVRSVRAAFTLPEVLTLAERAGLWGAAIEQRWPCRFLLSWKRPAP
jgi:SAM-dependent methyltransferase